MQLIYCGKIRKCLPRFKFPEKFSLSYNETHYSNEKEACKFIEEILQPYIKKVIERENLPVDQRSLVIMDLFKGQVTPMVLNVYKESNIVIVLVPDIAVLKAKYSADTQQVCDAGSDSE